MASLENLLEAAVMYQEASAKCSELAREHAAKIIVAKTPYERGCHESDYRWMKTRANQYYILQHRYRTWANDAKQEAEAVRNEQAQAQA